MSNQSPSIESLHLSNDDKSDLSHKSSSSEWDLIKDDYEILETIGAGAFGEVKKAIHKASKQVVAIKLMRNIFTSEYNAK